MNNNGNAKKVSFGAMFSVACVWFGCNVGSGFATGNQSMQYYVNFGWHSVFSSILTVLVLWISMREAVTLANTRGYKNYKELFCGLWAPYTKMEITYEIFYYIMILSAVGGCISGTATLLTSFGLSYYICILISGLVYMVLTIFGADLVNKASTVLSVLIIIAMTVICFVGIGMRADNIQEAIATRQTSGSVFDVIKGALLLGGAMHMSIPGVASCAGELKTKRSINISLVMGFAMLSIISCFTCWVLLGWHSEIVASGETTLPILYICKMTGSKPLYYMYYISLMCAFLTTGVSAIYGLVARLEGSVFKNAETGIFANVRAKRILISVASMVACMGISVVGLSAIVKYAYTYMGYWAIIFIMIPLWTIGRKKNKEFIKEHPDF